MTAKLSLSVYKKPGPKIGREVVQKLDYLKARKGFPKMYAPIPVSAMADVRLKHSDKLIYCSVAFFAWLDGAVCRESVAVVAALVNVSRSQAIEALKRLCACGYVERSAAKRGLPGTLTPVFRLEDAEIEVKGPSRWPARGKRKQGVSSVVSQARAWAETQAERDRGCA